jgi:hypothetical protein
LQEQIFPVVLEVRVVLVAPVRQLDLLVPVYRSVLTDRVRLVILEVQVVLVGLEALEYHFVQEALGKISELMQSLSLR